MSKDHHGLSRHFLTIKKTSCLSQYMGVSQLFKGFKNAELQGWGCVSVQSQIRFSEGAGEMAQWEKMLTTQACAPTF